MALIKFGGGVAGISGKIAGTVFARNKSGAYARNWAKPTNTPSVSQVNNRARFGSQSSNWSAVTSTDKATWEGLASGITRLNRFGEPYTPTGRQIYLESNNNLTAIGEAKIDTPPADYTPPNAPSAPTIHATVAGGVLTALTLSVIPDVDPSTYVFDATPLVSNSKNNVTNLWRQIGSGAGGIAPPNLLAFYTAVFGSAAAVGQIIWIRLRVLSTESGLASAPAINFLELT